MSEIPPLSPVDESQLKWDGFPHGDRFAVASVWLSAAWIFWVGTFAGLVSGLIALIRHRSRPNPSGSLHWAIAGIGLGLTGLITFPVAMDTIVSPLARHFENTAAEASIADVVGAYSGPSVTVPVFPPSNIARGGWTLPGGSAVHVVGPGVPSRNFKQVSVEVWNVRPSASGPEAATAYLATLSASGTCIVMKYNRGIVSTASYRPDKDFPCYADTARTDADWSRARSQDPTKAFAASG